MLLGVFFVINFLIFNLIALLFSQIPPDWFQLNSCPQYKNNSLYVGNTTVTFTRDELNKKGLFAAKNISAGTTLCIKTGIYIESDFWNYIDYERSMIQVAFNPKTNDYILMDRDNNCANYADYAQDSLNPNLVNA